MLKVWPPTWLKFAIDPAQKTSPYIIMHTETQKSGNTYEWQTEKNPKPKQ